MQPKDTDSAPLEVRIGPLQLQERIGDSHGAERFIATGPAGKVANLWRWPGAKLDGLIVPALAQLIEILQDVEIAGVSRIVHGSVATNQAVVAYTRPSGQPLSEYLRRGKTSPIEAVTSALTLLDSLAALHALGVRGAWWSPDTLWVMDDEAQWTLAAPGLVSALRQGTDASKADIVFRAPEASDVEALADLSDEAYDSIEVYSVGATLYYALSHQLPFDADSVEAWVNAQRETDAQRLDELHDYLAPYKTLVNLVAACLSADPAERPKSIEAVRRSLEDAEREARYQDSGVDFLPARVSDTLKIDRPGRGSETPDRAENNRSSMLPLLALVALIAIALFLIGR